MREKQNNRSRAFIVGLSSSGGTYLILKNLESVFHGDIFNGCRSPVLFHDEVNTKDQLREKNELGKGFAVFVDLMENNQQAIDPKFTAGKHKYLNVQYLTQLISDSNKEQTEVTKRMVC